jgi:hypothetical protein
MTGRVTFTPEEAAELHKLQAEFIEATVHAGASMRMAGESFDSEALDRVMKETERATAALRRIREILGE